MGRLLCVDFYKIFRTKFFYVVSLILVGFNVLISVTSVLAGLRNYEKFAFFESKSGAWSVTYANFSNIALLLAILSVLFLCSEFSHGTMKNIATKGFPREFIYLSKFFVGLSCAVFYLLLTIASSLISSLIAGGNRLPSYYSLPSNLALTLLLTLFFLAVYVSIALMIASLVRKSGNSLAIYVVASTLISFLPDLLDNFIRNTLNWDFSISSYIYVRCFNEITQMGIVSNIPSADIVRYVCVGVFFLALTLIIGIYYFRERDI